MTETITAPMSGRIMSLEVKVGDQVNEDDSVVVMEAMKMETLVYSPCDGSVAEIRVKEGDEVEEDDVLAVIE